MAEAVTAARLDLDEHDRVGLRVAGDDVELTLAAAPVTREDLQPLLLQQFGGELFAHLAEHVLRGHQHHLRDQSRRSGSRRAGGSGALGDSRPATVTCDLLPGRRRPAAYRWPHPVGAPQRPPQAMTAPRRPRSLDLRAAVAQRLSSALGSSSTLTSLKVTTRTERTKRAER